MFICVSLPCLQITVRHLITADSSWTWSWNRPIRIQSPWYSFLIGPPSISQSLATLGRMSQWETTGWLLCSNYDVIALETCQWLVFGLSVKQYFNLFWPFYPLFSIILFEESILCHSLWCFSHIFLAHCLLFHEIWPFCGGEGGA